MANLVELRVVSGMGQGLFAIQHIPRGTRVICEESLLRTPNDPDIIELFHRFESMTTEQHAGFCSLADNPEGELSRTQDRALRQYFSRTSQYSGRDLKAKLRDIDKMCGIYETNALSIGLGGSETNAVFLQNSRLNHSCRPNVFRNYNPTFDKLTAHAIRDIEANEELTTAYVPLLESEKERNGRLSNWEFKCQCEVCKDERRISRYEKWFPDAESLLDMRAFRQRRFRMLKVNNLINDFEKGIITDPSSSKPTAEDMLVLAEELVGLLKEEGLVGNELAIAYRSCSKYSLESDMYIKALAYTKKELEIERICIGTDTDYLKKNMAGAKYRVEHLESMKDKEMAKMRMKGKREVKEQKRLDKKAAKKAGKGGR